MTVPVVRLDSVQLASAMRIRSLADNVRYFTTWPLPLDCRAFINTNHWRLKSFVIQLRLDVSFLINNYSHRNAAMTATVTYTLINEICNKWFTNFLSFYCLSFYLCQTSPSAIQYKFDRGLSRILHTELHWLNVPERVMYKLCIMVHSCLHGQAPQYLVDLCLPVSDVASRQHLRSTSRRSWSFRDTGCERTADGLSLLLARRPGTHCQTILETRTLAETASANFWNRICSVITETSSALEVLRECAIQIYLLT